MKRFIVGVTVLFLAPVLGLVALLWMIPWVIGTLLMGPQIGGKE